MPQSDLTALVKAVAADNFIGTEIVGKGGGESEAFVRRKELMTQATTSQLDSLVNHENIVVSLSAFEGLALRGDESVAENIKVYLDNQRVQIIQGDIAHQVSALEYAYVEVLGYAMNNVTLTPDHEVLIQLTDDTKRVVERHIRGFYPTQRTE